MMLIGIYLQQPQYAVGSRLSKPNLKRFRRGVSPLKPEDEPCDAGHYVIGVSVARNLFLCLNVKNVVSSNSPS